MAAIVSLLRAVAIVFFVVVVGVHVSGAARERACVEYGQRAGVACVVGFRVLFRSKSVYTMAGACVEILGHISAASFATGPAMAEPFISPFGLTMTPALSSK